MIASLPSSQLSSLYTFARTALRPNGPTSLKSSPFSRSKTLPFHATSWRSLAAGSDRLVPGATSTVPSASPSGISPGGLRRKSFSSSSCGMSRRSWTSGGMCAPVWLGGLANVPRCRSEWQDGVLLRRAGPLRPTDDARKPALHGRGHRLDVSTQAVVARHLHDRPTSRGRGNAEPVALALHDQHGDGHLLELGQTARRRRPRTPARRLQRER